VCGCTYDRPFRLVIYIWCKRLPADELLRAYDNSSNILYVWVYNYGEVDIEVDVYVMGDAEGKNFSATATPILREETLEIVVPLQSENLAAGDELVVEVVSMKRILCRSNKSRKGWRNE